MKNVAPLILLLALTACAVGPDYEKPQTTVPQGWISGTNANAAIDRAWWKNFNDPVLVQFVDKAVAGNLDLQIAEARIAQARAARAAAGASLLPTGSIKGSATREANQFAFPGGGPPGFSDILTKPFNVFQTGFDASWELDLFGTHRREAEAAAASLQASEASRDDALVSLMAEVARTYVDIRQYQAQLATAEDTIKSDDTTFSIARERFKSGNEARLDVTQAEAQLERDKAQLPYYRNLLAQAQFSMDVLLGEQPGATQKFVATSAPIPLSDKNLTLAAPASVIANRPDIRVAERKLAAATAQQGVALAQFFPDVSLSGFIGLLNTDSGKLLQGASQSWTMGGSVVWPILNYGTLSANLDTADAQQMETMANYRKTIVAALADVEKSVTAYTEQDAYNALLTRSVEADKHAADIARQRYKEGLTSFLEVLDAQRTLYTGQSQLTEANARTTQNLVAVYKSLGGGWQKPAAKN